MSIKVTNEVPTYDDSKEKTIHVRSHNIDRDRVWVTIGDNEAVVIAADLEAAIRNATNKGTL